MSDIDHEYTNEIICPWCGYEHDRSYEFFSKNDESDAIECRECEKTFCGIRHVHITYSTMKPEVMTTYPVCARCSSPLVKSGKRGRPMKYCAACHQEPEPSRELMRLAVELLERGQRLELQR